MKLPEIIDVGIYNSKYGAKNVSVSKNRTTQIIEIELPIEAGGISYIDNKQANIKPNMLIFALPGQVRHTKFPYSCYFAHIAVEDTELFNTLSTVPNYLHTSNYSTYLELFKKLCKYNNKTEYKEIMLNSIMLEIIYLMCKEAKYIDIKSNTKQNTAIQKATKFIKENLSENLNLDTVAAYVSLSPIHFHNLFKSAVGKTLRDYVEEKRINQAINLLSTTDMTLAEIAYSCGFSSQSYFSFVFKRKLNTTPRKYLEKINQQYEI